MVLEREGSRRIAADERRRLHQLTQKERDERAAGYSHIAGVDEAGRGPLAGPVVAAACMIPDGLLFPGLKDSKQLTAIQREHLFIQLTSDPRIAFGIGVVESFEIDRVNIFQATIQAMLQAVAALSLVPDLLIVDGLALSHPYIPAHKVIGGDAECHCIAAASVIAKVHRDLLMHEYHQQWPEYGFDRHKGYGTKEHREKVSKLGPCPIHRRSFEPVKSLFRTSDCFALELR